MEINETYWVDPSARLEEKTERQNTIGRRVETHEAHQVWEVGHAVEHQLANGKD